MIRTHILPCKLKRDFADQLNLASGTIYTGLLVAHWRVVRKKHIWLSEKSGTRLSDSVVEAPLHAHSIDAAQQGFYKACKTAKAIKRIDPTTRYPHWTKKFRTTVWKQTAIKKGGELLELSNGLRNTKILIALPEELQAVLRFLEVRLVYDKKGCCYQWHVVVENGIEAQPATGNNIVSVDLGEIHPAVIGDEYESSIILCRERRHEAQGHAKRLASMATAISRKTKGSRRFKRLLRSKSRMKAHHERVIHDIEHKVSRAIVDVAIEQQANTIVVGDIKDIADGVALGKKTNQKISGWSHGKIRKLVEYKAAAEGLVLVLVDEHYTSQTCPTCGKRHKPKGRVYRCPSCGFQSHRDVVGQINILSVFKHGEVGKIAAPTIIKHRRPAAFGKRSMRSCLDTGQSQDCSSRNALREAAGF